MAPLRTTISLLLALALVAGVPSVAGQSLDAAEDPTSDCESVHAASVPLLHPHLDVAMVKVCDNDRDGVFDTVSFHTDRVHTSGGVSVTDETKQRADHQDRHTEADVRFSASGPLSPLVQQSVAIEDEGNDGQVDNVEHAGVAFTRLAAASYILQVLDDSGDRLPDGYGLTLCASFVGCSAPGPNLIPTVPDRVDLPDTVVHIDPVGYVP